MTCVHCHRDNPKCTSCKTPTGLLNHNRQNLGILSILLRAGFISSISRGIVAGPDPVSFKKVKEYERWIWANLKYGDDQAVLTNMELISRPSQRVFMSSSDLRLICSGRRSGRVKPLGMGEVAMVKKEHKQHEWLEAREALQLKIPGEPVCRAR